MISAFGVDHGDVIVKADRHNKSGAAIAGVGATTAGVGLVAGGVPGAKVDGNSVFRTKPGQGRGARRVASEVRGKAPAIKATPGGILGFRGSIHELGTHFFREQEKLDNAKKATENKQGSFYRGYNAGKIKPEENIMRGMKIGRRASHGALGAGLATAAYGVHRARTPVKKSDDRTKTYNSALVGTGVAGAGIAHGGSKYLRGQQKKFEARAAQHVDEAGAHVPALAGRHGKQMSLKQMGAYRRKNPDAPWPKSMHPVVRDGEIKRNPSLLNGVSPHAAEAAGRLRGAAAQERHFSEVFGSTAKVVRGVRTPAAIVGAVGAGGLLAGRKRPNAR